MKMVRIAVAVSCEDAEKRYRNYFTAMSAFGAIGIPIGAPCDVSDCAGLLLPGGVDIDPGRYRQKNIACEDCDTVLDDLQFTALEFFARAGKPVFGICRGHQLINVFFGGTLIQHLPQSLHHSRCGMSEDNAHIVTTEKNSILFGLYGEKFPVNSAHHQAVDAVGYGLHITQRSDDGIVEAMEHDSLPVFSVQWHPERMCLKHLRKDTVDGAKILKYFTEMCRLHNDT